MRKRRARHLAIWRLVNPPLRLVAGSAPWWVLLETRGRVSGQPRRTPLARGPMDDGGIWLSAVHGRRALWVRNLEAASAVRIKLAGRWRDGEATVHEFDEAVMRRFNSYARGGPRLVGIEPALVRVEFRRAGRDE